MAAFDPLSAGSRYKFEATSRFIRDLIAHRTLAIPISIRDRRNAA